MRNRKTTVDVVRAWKDPAYRATLSSEQLARIPASPAGVSELDSNVLGEVGGGVGRPKTRPRSTCGGRCLLRPTKCFVYCEK